ncbi:unnamed protein product [Pylaiella littoralis]
MEGSIEEEELTAQRDAVVSLCKGLQEKIRAQAEEYEARTEAAEMGRIEAEIELEHLRREESGCAMTARGQVRTVTAGWLVGVILGWGAGFVLGCLFSPALGFMLVLPLVSAGVIGGLIYSQLRDKMRSLRQDTQMGGHQHQQQQQQQQRQQQGGLARDFEDKEEFLRQLQGRSDPSATYLHLSADNRARSGSFLRRVATGAAHVLVRSALDVTAAAAYAMLGLGSGGTGARGGRTQGR